jgi:hypothetical protein
MANFGGALMPNPQRRALFSWLLVGCFVPAFALAQQAAVPTGMPATTEGLVKVPSKRLGAVYLRPGADFRAYTKIMIDPVQVSFRPGWLKDINSSRGVTGRVSEQDAQQIAEAMRSGFADIFAQEFKAKGYEVVNAPAPDVVRVSAEIANVYLNAPNPMGGGAGTRTYTVEAGEATLALAARDSTTGAVLGVALDRRTTGGAGHATFTTSSSNRFEFEELFHDWSRACVRGLEELKTRSPLTAKSGGKR